MPFKNQQSISFRISNRTKLSKLKKRIRERNGRQTPMDKLKHQLSELIEAKDRSSRLKISVFGSCMLLVLLTVFVFALAGSMDIPLLFFKTSDFDKPETYVSVGPLLSSAGSGDLIKMTIDLNCYKKSYRTKISDLDNKIRNRMISVIQSSEAEKLISSGDYIGFRRYMSNRVMDIIPDGTVREIYLAEFLRY